MVKYNYLVTWQGTAAGSVMQIEQMTAEGRAAVIAARLKLSLGKINTKNTETNTKTQLRSLEVNTSNDLFKKSITNVPITK